MTVAFSLFAVLGIIAVIAIIGAVIALIAFKKPEELTATGKDSYFDGSALGLFGWHWLGNFLTAITFGIAYPWAMCMVTRWEVKHTVINGRRLKFNGNGAQLFGKYILWAFLTIITFGIYSIWMGLGLEKWKVKHTVYADKKGPDDSRFVGTAGGWFVNHLLFAVLTAITFGIAYPWADVGLRKWKAKNTVIGGSPLVFKGKGGTLWLKLLLCGILTPLTLGIYPIFIFPVTLLKWHYKNTLALYRTSPIIALSRAHEENANKDFAKIRLAANDAELASVKSGFTGNENDEELEALASSGNVFAAYALANKLKGDSPKYDGRALELLKTASDAKHHQAMFEFSDHIENVDEKIALLEESARLGNAEAAWVLKKLYLKKADNSNNKNRIDILTKTAYWFKVAIELEIPEAVNSKPEYDELLDLIAIYHAGNQKSSGGSAVGIIVAAAVGGGLILICFLLAFVLGLPVLRFGGQSEARPVMENSDRISIASGSSEYCSIKQDDLFRYDDSEYKPFVESSKTIRTLSLNGQQAEVIFYLRSNAYYDERSENLYLDFGISDDSNIDGNKNLSVFFVCENLRDSNGNGKVLGGYLRPGERILKIPCKLPSNLTQLKLHIILANSDKPETALKSSLWVADIYQTTLRLSETPIGEIGDSNEVSGDITDDDEEEESAGDKLENIQYAYSFGGVKTDPTNSDFEAFYSMIKDNPEMWMKSNSFISANMDAKTLIENYVFDDGMSWGFFSRFALDSDLVTRPEYQNVQQGMSFQHARYKASDVDWVLKAVFDVDPVHYGQINQSAMFYEGDYFYRMASELYMGTGMTNISDFGSTYEKIDDGVYRITVSLKTKWEYDEEPPQSHVWEFIASPMHSQNLGTYWRIISFTKI